jgi:hypothetical protein
MPNRPAASVIDASAAILAATSSRPDESIHFLGVLRGQLCLLATAEFWIPSLKSSAEFVIEDVHAHLQ